MTLGAFLTAVRARLTSIKYKNRLHLVFYILSGIVALSVIVGSISFYDMIFFQKNGKNWTAIIILILAFISSFLLIYFTRRYLVGKYQYKTSELDPIVNKFTENADKANIRLLAGDLNLFGKTPHDMDNNSQYKSLKNCNFRSVQILCFKPKYNVEKIRYGKLISDMPVELRYYHPPQADLNVRGRMKTLNNVTYLLIYNKIRSELYEALELDTANANGALYNHIWNLIWQLAEPVSKDDLDQYVELYRN